jgi:hypothetical protein
MRVSEAVQRGQAPGPDPAIAAVKTYRYLRLAMVAMVLGLGVAVVHEVVRVQGHCWQPSLSGYYYTPVQHFLVGALVTIGVCLVVLRGNTDAEDALLNFAGICAPFVALVPFDDPGTCGVVTDDPNRHLTLANNVTALLAVIGVALMALAAFSWRNRGGGDEPQPSRIAILGYAESVLLYIAAVAVFWLQRDWFEAYGHLVAAVAMFAFVFLNVVVNAVNLYYGRRGTPDAVGPMNRYTWIALAMAVSVAGTVVLWALGFEHWLLTIEASLITCFAVFWIFQTWELWDQGLRTDEPGTTEDEPDGAVPPVVAVAAAVGQP